jgi:polar amino acid transport system substrate-binding protein
MGRPHLTVPLALLAAACGLPRDPGGTLDRVRGGDMRVGLVAAPPWVVDSGGGAVGGVEVALVGALARELGARVRWVRAPESHLMESLHRRELDLVIGGVTATSPWAKQVALTRPYYTDTVAVGVAAGAASPASLEGRTVAVEAGSPVAADVRSHGATPLGVDDLRREAGPVAAPTWRLAALGRDRVLAELREERHVLAAPPGENAWLVRVERLLHARERAVPGMLRAAAR